MKTLLVLSVVFFSYTGFAANAKKSYTYNSYPITTRTYKKLYKQFKNKLFVLSDGKVIYPADSSGNTKKISFLNKQLDRGEITGKIIKIIDKNTFILKVKEIEIKTHYSRNYHDRISGKKGTKINFKSSKYFTVAIFGANTSSLFKGEDFTANVIAAGAYILKYSPVLTSGQRMRKFDVMKPITETEFKKYLDVGNKLYTYRKCQVGYIPCEKCNAKGYKPNPNYKKGKLSAKTIDCPACKYGKNPKYKYVKIAIKPRKKKIASR